MKRRANQGFTIVELLVVIVVIAIVTGITVVLYMNAQQQARDVQIRDASGKISEAVALWMANHNGERPNGGVIAGNSLSGDNCVTGNVGFTAYNVKAISPANYGCTVGDALVAGGYLSNTFFSKLPADAAVDDLTEHLFISYSCNGSAFGTNDTKVFIIMYALESPTAAESATAADIQTKCGQPNYRDIWNMHGTVVMPYSPAP